MSLAVKAVIFFLAIIVGVILLYLLYPVVVVLFFNLPDYLLNIIPFVTVVAVFFLIVLVRKGINAD